MKLFMIFCLFSLTALAVEEEESEALRALRLSCEKHKVGLGCFNYANMLVRSQKSDVAEKYFEMGCKLSHEQSCAKEKWDLPERKAIPEIVELPATPPETEAESESQSSEAINLPSKVSIRQDTSSESESESTEAPTEPAVSQEPSTPASEAETQSEASKGPVEDLNSATPAEGSVAEPSVTE